MLFTCLYVRLNYEAETVENYPFGQKNNRMGCFCLPHAVNNYILILHKTRIQTSRLRSNRIKYKYLLQYFIYFLFIFCLRWFKHSGAFLG